MGSISNRSLLILLVIVAFLYFGTPLVADLFFELYHLTGFDFIYTIYGALRYATAQFMFWDNRWAVTLIVAAVGLTILWFRAHRRSRTAAET